MARAARYRRPLTVVVGDPIDVDKVEEPSDEQIAALRDQCLSSLFNQFEPCSTCKI